MWFLIIKQERYKKFPILIFYVLSYCVVFGRIENYACVIKHIRNLSTSETESEQETIAAAVAGYLFACSAKIIIGLF